MIGTKRVLCILFLTIIFPIEAKAYLDPGSGSMLLYAILATLAAIAYALRGMFYRIKYTIAGLFSKKVSSSAIENDIVFFSEGAQYWAVFYPVIKSLLGSGYKVSYLTQSAEDRGLTYKNKNFNSTNIGFGAGTYIQMNRLRAKIVVMTTPQLDIMMLKRSKYVGHYMHILHAPTDALVYKKFAFDYFDSVCCCGPHQVESIRALEQLRGLPEKDLPITGMTYYDTMLEEMPNIGVENRTVLIAPTWGRHALFAKHGVGFIRKLANKGLQIIIRPHPQVKKSDPEIFKSLEELSHGTKSIELDTSPSGINSMARAAVLVTDLSGIIFDFLFVFSRPVIAIDPHIDGQGHEAEDVDKQIWEVGLVEQLCMVVPGDELNKLHHTVNDVLQQPLSPKIQTIKEKFIANFGKAGAPTAKQIIQYLSLAKEEVQ